MAVVYLNAALAQPPHDHFASLVVQRAQSGTPGSESRPKAGKNDQQDSHSRLEAIADGQQRSPRRLFYVATPTMNAGGPSRQPAADGEAASVADTASNDQEKQK